MFKHRNIQRGKSIVKQPCRAESRQRGAVMENMDCLVKYVEEKGNLDVMQIGAFMQWKTKTGESMSASVSQIHEEWSQGR